MVNIVNIGVSSAWNLHGTHTGRSNGIPIQRHYKKSRINEGQIFVKFSLNKALFEKFKERKAWVTVGEEKSG